jgi:hypothetical protein
VCTARISTTTPVTQLLFAFAEKTPQICEAREFAQELAR